MRRHSRLAQILPDGTAVDGAQNRTVRTHGNAGVHVQHRDVVELLRGPACLWRPGATGIDRAKHRSSRPHRVAGHFISGVDRARGTSDRYGVPFHTTIRRAQRNTTVTVESHGDHTVRPEVTHAIQEERPRDVLIPRGTYIPCAKNIADPNS